MLSIRERQTYLKYLGLYKGSIDGIEGRLTKEGYKSLQNKFFARMFFYYFNDIFFCYYFLI